MLFRDLGKDQEYRLFINHRGVWTAEWNRINSNGDRIHTTIDGGQLSNMIKGENISNEIELFVNDDFALFYLNEKYISRIDITWGYCSLH